LRISESALTKRLKQKYDEQQQKSKFSAKGPKEVSLDWKVKSAEWIELVFGVQATLSR